MPRPAPRHPDDRRWWGPVGRARWLLLLIGVVLVVAVVGLVLVAGDDDEGPGAAGSAGVPGTPTDDPTGDGAPVDTGPVDPGAAGPVDPGAPDDAGPNAPSAPDPDAPEGSRSNPLPVGSVGEIGGWRVTVVSAADGVDVVRATVALERLAGTGPGDPADLVLRVNDARAVDHPLGGPACPAGADRALADLGQQGSGTPRSVELCWTTPAAERASSALVVEVVGVADSVFLALA